MNRRRALVDQVAALLTADEEVPVALAATLLAALPCAEREAWLRTLVELAWRPANLTDHTPT